MRKKKKNQDEQDDDEGGDGSENEESQEEEHVVERTFNFIGELTVLVDYDVIQKYVFAILHPILSKDCDMLIMTSSFFKRVFFQFKQPWVFFQVEFLAAFESFLTRNKSNNVLMNGI